MQKPLLRFPEFSDNWEMKLLEDMAIRGSGHTPSKAFDSYYDGNIPWVSLADSKYLDQGFIEKTTITISKDGIKNSSAVLHKSGCVLLSRDAGIGKSAVMKVDMAVSQHFIVWRPLEGKLSNWFLYYRLQIHKPEFERIAIGSTIKTIGLPYFKSLTFNFPQLPEQTKIANFLTSVDEKINALKEKKRLFEEYKKGLTQKIFSQEIRFKLDDGSDFPDWEEKSLGEIAIKKSSSISANKIEENFGDFIIYGAAGILKLVDFYEEENDYVSIVKDGAGAGRLLFCNGKSSVLGTMEIIKPKSDMNTHFLFYLISTFDFTKYVTGSTIPHIYFRDYSLEICGVPSLHEQQKIANFLSSIDGKIEKLGQQIGDAQTFKKGLLQQMFV